MVKIKPVLLFIFLTLVLVSCQKEDEKIVKANDFSTKYDVILVIGQSNAYCGYGYDKNLDKPDDKIWQLGRFDDNNYKIIPAKEPLEHFTINKDYIGFAMTFATYYKKSFLENDRQILIIPAAFGGTGFINNYWNVGDTLYKDAIERTNFVLANYYNSKLVAILWHQGEADILNETYQQCLDSMIISMRNELVGQRQDVPFILGGFVPYWTEQSYDRVITNKIVEETPNRIPFTGYANPRIPYTIVKQDNTVDEIHFDAAGQRELGRRYFTEYSEMVTDY